MRVLFLYTELAGYFFKCCEGLSETAQVHVVRWPVNKEAPFKFGANNMIKIYDRYEFDNNSLTQLAESINPDVIVCSGWIDKGYLRTVKNFSGKIPTVLALDTKWENKPRQYVAALLSRVTLKPIFSHAWVPGQAQRKYAKLLGFRMSRIHDGFYCCDLDTFNAVFTRCFTKKKAYFPKRFLFVGRYYKFKGVQELWQSFAELHAAHPGWELWCCGTGDLAPFQHPAIKHFGFVQPLQMEELIREAGVFVLPSHKEPWGVVVQEFAAAGLPLVLSDKVGAREVFLEEGVNGFCYQAANKSSLKEALKKVMELDVKTLTLMSEHSHRLAQRITQKQWRETVARIHDQFLQK